MRNYTGGLTLRCEWITDSNAENFLASFQSSGIWEPLPQAAANATSASQKETFAWSDSLGKTKPINRWRGCSPSPPVQTHCGPVTGSVPDPLWVSAIPAPVSRSGLQFSAHCVGGSCVAMQYARRSGCALDKSRQIKGIGRSQRLHPPNAIHAASVEKRID